MANKTLAEHRKELGLTQEQVAKTVGLDRKTVVNLETGRYPADRATAWTKHPVWNASFLRLCELYDVKPENVKLLKK